MIGSIHFLCPRGRLCKTLQALSEVANDDARNEGGKGSEEESRLLPLLININYDVASITRSK